MKSKPSPYRPAWLAFAAVGLLLVATLPAAAQSHYDDYHTRAEVESALKGFADAHPEAKLKTIGESAAGHPIHVLALAAEGEIDPSERQAVFVGANIAGFHNAGTEAALHLIETLLGDDEASAILSERTFYVAPMLNPDAHDGMFATPRTRHKGNGQSIDYDGDGLVGEDGPNDLDGDGVIRTMRIADPAGRWLIHPEDPRVMIRADSMKERAGAYRVMPEGYDDDKDGKDGEDAAEGVVVDMNFAHAYLDLGAESGPWPSYAPEAKAIMDFLLNRRNVALAFVYGPANNLLATPQSLGGGDDDLGSLKFTVPEGFAEFLGLEADVEYTLDEIWGLIKDLPFIVNQGITIEQVGQFLGAGPATQVAQSDMAYINAFAKDYKKRLKDAGLSNDRDGAQYGKGGFTPWLYYQYGVMALELDVWGVPKPEKPEEEEAEGEEKPKELTLEALETMTADEFLEFDEETIAKFLKDNNVPAQFNSTMVINAVKGGQITPERMYQMVSQGGGGGGDDDGEGAEDDPQTKKTRELLTWVEANAPDAWSDWTTATLPDGTEVEVGGLDPFVRIAPPKSLLDPAIAVHTATILDIATKLAKIEIVSLDVEPLGGGVHRVKALARNNGYMASHTDMAKRAQSHLPVRLELVTGDGVELVTGYPATAEERLEGTSGTLESTWLVRAGKGSTITVRVLSENAGNDTATHTVG